MNRSRRMMTGCAVPTRVRITRFYTAFRATYDRSFYFDGESHDFWELVYVVDGAVGVTAGNEVHTLRQGQLLLHPPLEFHRIWAAENTDPTVIILSFQAEALQIGSGEVYTLPAERGQQLEQILSSLRQSHVAGTYMLMRLRADGGEEAARAACALESVLLSLPESGRPDTLDRSVTAQHYRTIIAVMETHLSEPLTIDRLAQLCRMSESALKKTFRRYTGLGVMHYFAQMKIRRAMDYLRSGERICDVSERLGFENQNYFSTVFRRITGKSPSEFRKMAE